MPGINAVRAPARGSTVPARRHASERKAAPYKVSPEVVREIVRHRLKIGGRIDNPAIAAPYGLFNENGKRVVFPGTIFEYNHSSKVSVLAKGAELCVPAIIKDFQSRRDVLKLFACREHTQVWENEEIKTGKAGPFLSDNAVTREMLKKFSELDEAAKSEIRFYANIFQITSRFLKLSQDCGVIHTEHLPSKIYMFGPAFPHPESVSKGQALFLMDYKLPSTILTELGHFQMSSFAAMNDPKKMMELSKRFYSELNVIDVNRYFSFSNQYPFMSEGKVTIKHYLDNESGQHEKKTNRWFAIRDFVYLLHKI